MSTYRDGDPDIKEKIWAAFQADVVAATKEMIEQQVIADEDIGNAAVLDALLMALDRERERMAKEFEALCDYNDDDNCWWWRMKGMAIFEGGKE